MKPVARPSMPGHLLQTAQIVDSDNAPALADQVPGLQLAFQKHPFALPVAPDAVLAAAERALFPKHVECRGVEVQACGTVAVARIAARIRVARERPPCPGADFDRKLGGYPELDLRGQFVALPNLQRR